MSGAAMLALLLVQAASGAPATPVVATVVDPARLEVATRVAARLLPNGTYQRMMTAMTDQMIGLVTTQMSDMPLRNIVKMSGISEADAAKLGPGTIKDMMAILDPAYQQRTDITMRIMFEEMGRVMSAMEPDYRAGLSEALATRFTAEQLGELDRFFMTPTGSAYAAHSMQMYADPALMRRMQGMMPRVMEAMPAIVKKIAAATAGLPAIRDPKTLTKDDQARLEALLLTGEKK